MTYKDFKTKWETEILSNKEGFIREGQALINFLGDVWFEEYKRISSVHYYDQKDIDCFYNDSLIPNTWKHLEKVWREYPN